MRSSHRQRWRSSESRTSSATCMRWRVTTCGDAKPARSTRCAPPCGWPTKCERSASCHLERREAGSSGGTCAARFILVGDSIADIAFDAIGKLQARGTYDVIGGVPRFNRNAAAAAAAAAGAAPAPFATNTSSSARTRITTAFATPLPAIPSGTAPTTTRPRALPCSRSRARG